MGVHILAATLFIAVTAFHLFFNWKILLSYFRLKTVKGFRLKKEFTAAVAVSLFVVIGGFGGIPPFSTIVELNGDIKDYWETNAGPRAPMAHAEELGLDEFARQVNMPLEDVLTTLAGRGIEVSSPTESLAGIAGNNDLVPSDIHEVLRGNDREGDSQPMEPVAHGFRLGTLTLREYCETERIGIRHFVAALKERGVQATESSMLRELSQSLQISPKELILLAR